MKSTKKVLKMQKFHEIYLLSCKKVFNDYVFKNFVELPIFLNDKI